MERREFLSAGSRCCAAAGMFAVSVPALVELAEASQEKKDEKAPSHSSDEVVEFAEGWVKRFMEVLDKEIDEPTRIRLMEANGRACAAAFLASKHAEFRKRVWDEWITRVQDAPDGSLVKDGNTIIHAYMTNYQGKKAPEGSCLCPLVEKKPEGLSATYCACSVGYVREIWGRWFDVPLKVELLESTLRGGKHCRFRIQKA